MWGQIKIHYVEIDWASSKITADQALSQDTTWRNVMQFLLMVNRIAALKDKQNPLIWIGQFLISIKVSGSRIHSYNPTTSTSNNKQAMCNIPDAMDFDITGNTLMYDSYNKYKTSKGTDADYWDISFIKVHDGETGAGVMARSESFMVNYLKIPVSVIPYMPIIALYHSI